MLTARDAVEDRIAGLDVGADDYLTKPFSFAELLARLRAIVRRGPVERPTILEVGDLRLDPATRQVWRGTSEIELTAKEFALLEAFMRRPGEVLSRDHLLEQAWDMGYDNRSNVIAVYARADAFLFGRRTYEIFAASWGLMKDPSRSPIGQALHSRRKYVASSTLTEPRWADTTVIAGEVAAVSELKAEPGGELQVHGSGALVRWLLGNELVDEINLVTFPVIIGQGTRLFADTGPDVALDLVDTRTTPSGVTIQVFRPSGRPEYATSTAKASWQ
jgi:dihydrofolate reductase